MTGILVIAAILLIIGGALSLLSTGLSIFRIAVDCVIIHKGEGNWWKGLIPFYSRWVYIHLGFAHKSAVMVFIIEMILFVVSFGLRLTVNILEEVNDAFANSSVNLSDSFYNTMLAMSGVGLILALITLVVLFVYSLEKRFTVFAMCKAFGKETGMCVAAFFVPTIISAIIAFGSSDYQDDVIEIIPEY